MTRRAYLLFGFILLVFVFLCNVEAAARIPATLEPGPKSDPRISISLGTPPQKQLLGLDLDASVSYLPCKKFPSFFRTRGSSSYKSISCSSKLCSKLNPGVASSCKLQEAENCTIPVNNKTSISLFRDSVAFKGARGPSTRALLGCSTEGPLKLAAMSRSRRALPFTITSSNNLPRKFTLCLSPGNASKSSIFFGDDSSFILGGINVSNYVQFIPLKVNPLFPSSYFLSLTGIRIDSSQVSLPPSLFSINPTTGTGGLKLSTRHSFSKLPTPAYQAIAEAFKSFAAKFDIPTVAPVAPVTPVEPSLKLCFNASSFSYNRLGPVVPVVELVFENGLSWRLGGSSTISVTAGAGCLAFVDAGQPPVKSTIGLFQMLDNLLHFDVAASRFGFVDSSLHSLGQNCRTSFS